MQVLCLFLGIRVKNAVKEISNFACLGQKDKWYTCIYHHLPASSFSYYILLLPPAHNVYQLFTTLLNCFSRIIKSIS